MALFKGTPAYFGEGGVPCQRTAERGFFCWIARLLGFPESPCYQPPDPPEVIVADPSTQPPIS